MEAGRASKLVLAGLEAGRRRGRLPHLAEEANLAAGDTADEVEVAVEEVERGEGEGVLPEDLFKGFGAGLAVKGVNAVEEKDEGGAAGQAVLVAGDFGSDFGFDAEFLAQLAAEGLFGGLAGFDLATGELPLEAVAIAGHALSDEDFAVTLEDTGDYDHCARHAGWKKMDKELVFHCTVSGFWSTFETRGGRGRWTRRRRTCGWRTWRAGTGCG